MSVKTDAESELWIDPLKMVVAETTRENIGLMEESQPAKEKLFTNCEIIKRLLAKYHGNSIDAEVDKGTKDIIITIELKKFEFDGAFNESEDLFKSLNSFSFKRNDDGKDVVMEFRFPGIWKKV